MTIATAHTAAQTAAAPVTSDDLDVRKDAALVSFEDDDTPSPTPRYRHFTLSDGSVGYEPIEG